MKCCATLQGLSRFLSIVGAGLLLLWIFLHAETLYANQNGGIRFSLTTLFALLIFFRPKKIQGLEDTHKPPPRRPPAFLLVTLVLLGVAAVIFGLIIPMRQLEWIGILLLVFACLATAMPATHTRDILFSLLVLYWANPLPNQLFGSLQLGMQIASVRGAEWFLHLINVRVWADGMVLYSGTRIFEVPAWCSGMRTATTVFILSLAIGILRRMRPAEALLFILWSLGQALSLNILRISAMVYFAPMLKDKAGLTYLHDTAGLLVIASVFLVYVELLVLEHARRRRSQKRNMLKAAREGGLSEYPPFWHRFLRFRGSFFGSLLLITITALAAYHSRPHHRTRMLQDVALTLRDMGDIENARRLANIVLTREPHNLDWRFTAIRMDLIAGDAQRVLDALDPLTDISPTLQLQRQILRAYALMRIGRFDEAITIINDMPEASRSHDPRIAMVLAEMALRRNDAYGVSAHVITAGQWAPNAGRIRNLYPFLRIHRKWNAMAATDFPVPYQDPAQTFSILEAFMNLNNVPRVAEITLQAMTRLPNDPRVLEPLFFMAIMSGGDWEQRFSKHLLRCIPLIQDPQTLYEMNYKCFRLARPDLAWAIYRRMQSIDPGHPVLPMTAVEYGHRWFVFRRHFLNLPAGSPAETIDLKPFYILGNLLPGWNTVTQSIPLGGELATADTTPVRKAYLRQAIDAFAERERDGMLPTDLQYLYAQAQERSGRIDLARDQLDAIVRSHPEEATAARVLLSEMLERKGDWVQVYETLRTYLSGDASPPTTGITEPQIPAWPPVATSITSHPEDIYLNPLLRLTESQLELHFTLAAVFTARKTLQLYPYSPRAKNLLASALLRENDAEAALQILSESRVRNLQSLDMLEAEALFTTQRFGELAAFCRERLLPQIQLPPATLQNASLPPAELSLLWHRAFIPSEAEFAETAKSLRKNLDTASDGLRPLLSLWLEAYENGCIDGRADPVRWLATGRDRLEQATALNLLTLLLCRENRFADALQPARLAVASLPESPRLWQILVSLSAGDAETIALARHFCPDDADLWLADLVMQTRPDGPSKTDTDKQTVRTRANQMLDAALETNTIHPAGLTRAAEYLWRGGLYKEASRITAGLTDSARGLLPAYILCVRTALLEQNKELALKNAKLAIEAAIAPMPELYEDLVLLKSGNGSIDTDIEMVNALRQLRKSDPDNQLWAQMLGYIRYQRGGWEVLDAMFQMNVAIAGGATNQVPYLISAEVSRLLRNYDRAADTLRKALQLNPDNPVIINNLAYALSQDKQYITEAVALVPDLTRIADTDPRVRDTLAVVYLASGDLERARKTLVQTLRDSDPGSPLWFRSQMHLAEIAWKQGNSQTAISMLDQLLKGSKSIPDEDILAANALFSRITNEQTPIE